MTLNITKEINIYDYEVDIELDESEVLEEIDSVVVLNYVIDNYPPEKILNKLEESDIVNFIVKDKEVLAALLRKIADKLDV